MIIGCFNSGRAVRGGIHIDGIRRNLPNSNKLSTATCELTQRTRILGNSSHRANLHSLSKTYPGASLMYRVAYQRLGIGKESWKKSLYCTPVLPAPSSARSPLQAVRESGALRVISPRHSRALPSAFQRPFKVWRQSIRVERFPKEHKARCGTIEEKRFPTDL